MIFLRNWQLSKPQVQVFSFKELRESKIVRKSDISYHLNARVRKAVSYGNSSQFREWRPHWRFCHDVISQRGDVLSCITLACQEERTFLECRILSEEVLQCIVQVTCHRVLILGYIFRSGGDTETCTNWIIHT